MDNSIEYLEKSLLKMSDRTGVSFYELRRDNEIANLLFSKSYSDALQYVFENYETEE